MRPTAQNTTDYCGKYGARMYDATVCRFWTLDAYAEKYINLTPYHYAANNPILNIDVNGDSLTPNAMKWANKIISEANTRIGANNKKIAELDNKLKEGKIKQKTYDRRVNRLKEANTGLEAAKVEIDKLKRSSQWYDVQEQTGLTNENGEKAGGITTFDFKKNMVVILYDTEYGTEVIAHEFKHAYQFESGDLALSPEGSAGFLWDVYNEREANTRASYFGGSTFTRESGSETRQKLESDYVAEHYYKKFKESKKYIAFRYNGKTYVTP